MRTKKDPDLRFKRTVITPGLVQYEPVRHGRVKKKAPVLESNTENWCVTYACGKRVKGKLVGGRGCVHYKLNGIGKMAKPDQEFVTPNGYNWYVEFKREGEQPTELQRDEAALLLDRGQMHSFVWTREEFKFKLEWILRLPPRTRPKEW